MGEKCLANSCRRAKRFSDRIIPTDEKEIKRTMSWRGDTPPLIRFLASLPYLLPIMDAYLFFSRPFFSEFPELEVVFLPLTPLLVVYTSILRFIPFLGGLLIFILLFALVVRNESIHHFIRFNTIQSIIIGIAMSLVSIIWSYMLSPVLGGSLIGNIIFNVVFLGTLGACIYSMVLSWMGRYAEIPTLSDAAYSQVR